MGDDRTTFRCRQPGDLTGKKPKSFGTGRLCRCGNRLNQYTVGEWCNRCLSDAARQAQFADLEPGVAPMEPEKMTTKQVKDFLDLSHARDVKNLAAEGHFEVLRAGRGLWGNTYVADTVRAYKDRRDAHLDTEDGGRTSTPLPKVAIHQVVDTGLDAPATDGEIEAGKATRTFMEGEDLPEDAEPRVGPGPTEDGSCCSKEGDACTDCPERECCGDPDNCDRDCGETTLRAVPDLEGEPQDTQQSFEDYVQERMEQFGQHLAVHLQAIDRAANAQRVYLESMTHAKSSGTEAYRLMAELDRLGIKVGGPEPMGQPVFLAVEDEKLPDDPEIAAMYQVQAALEGLDRAAQLRVLRWVSSKFGLDAPPATEPVE